METVTTPSQAVGEGRDAGPAERLVHVERVDDLPVLFASVQRLGVAELLERQFHNHEHHFGKGELTFGEVVSVWLTFLLSQGDHRLDRLQPWAQEHQRTLQALLGKPVGALDCHDDRLADVLDGLPQEGPWQALEADLNGQAVRAYDLEASLVRVDPTTANSSASVLSEHGLIQFGHSKGRDDLPQIQGLVLLLSIALRVLTLLEWVVRRRLLQGQEKLKGLYPGQPGRQTGRPSAELLLRAFRGISLVVEQVAGQLVRLLTPLNALQQRLLALLDLPGDLYARLELHFAEPPPH